MAISLVAIAVATLRPGGEVESLRLPASWCIKCGDGWLTDVVSNVVLFVPLGLAIRGLRRDDDRGILTAVLWGLLVTLAVESLQAAGVAPRRNPAIADLLSNTAGAALGAFLPNLARLLVSANAAVAAGLSLLWSSVAAIVFLATSLAVQPASEPPTPMRVATSHFTYAPAYGWYQGRVDSARVGGQLFVRGEAGPIVLEASHAPTALTLTVSFDGNEPLPDRKPALFVHQRGDSSALFAVSKHGTGLDFVAARRGDRWGLVMPVVYIRNVFAPARVAQRGGPAKPIHATAEATPEALMLQVHDGTGTQQAALPYSPGMGWALVQNLAHPLGPLAWPITVAWLLVLVGPAGWAAARAGTGPGLLLLSLPLAGWSVAGWYSGIRLVTSEGAVLAGVMLLAYLLSYRQRARAATFPGRPPFPFRQSK